LWGREKKEDIVPTPKPALKSKTPVRFRKNEIARAVRGAQDIGLTVHRIEVDPASGKISLVTGTESKTQNELDHWMRQHAGSTQRS
jgi:hypothetical protein